jgi:hypothetical protein
MENQTFRFIVQSLTNTHGWENTKFGGDSVLTARAARIKLSEEPEHFIDNKVTSLRIFDTVAHESLDDNVINPDNGKILQNCTPEEIANLFWMHFPATGLAEAIAVYIKRLKNEHGVMFAKDLKTIRKGFKD